MKQQVRFSSTVVAVIIILFGIGIYLLNHFFSPPGFFDVVKDISLLLISSGGISLLITISTLKRDFEHTINLFQKKMLTDFSRLNDSEIDNLVVGAMKFKRDKRISIRAKSFLQSKNVSVNDDFNLYVERIYQPERDATRSYLYDLELTKEIKLIIRDDGIHVNIVSDLININPLKVKYKFRMQHMFANEREAQHYEIVRFVHNDHDVPNSKRDLWGAPCSKDKQQILVLQCCKANLSDSYYNRVITEVRYIVPYAGFFHTHIFRIPCKSVRVIAELSDERTQKIDNCVLNWEYFSFAHESTQVAKSAVANNENEFILQRAGLNQAVVRTHCQH